MSSEKPMNSVTEIPGIFVAHATNAEAGTGCTVICCPEGATGGVDVRGGAPATRETDLLRPEETVDVLHAVVLSGGSAYGLAASCGVAEELERRGFGLDVGVARVPIVSGACLFDLACGIPSVRPTAEDGRAACAAALDGAGTPLERALREGRVQAVDEETSLALFNHLIDRLEAAGYVHYEISNFARPHREALHNSGYWADAPYLGLGPSAHSYDRESRQWNVASLPAYLAALLRPDGQPLFERERLTPRDRYDDYIITRTRTRRGLSPTEILAQFGPAYHAHFQRQARRAVARGLLMTDGDRLRLTRTGLFISDSVMVDLLAE